MSFFLTGTPLKIPSISLHSKLGQKSVKIYLPANTRTFWEVPVKKIPSIIMSRIRALTICTNHYNHCTEVTLQSTMAAGLKLLEMALPLISSPALSTLQSVQVDYANPISNSSSSSLQLVPSSPPMLLLRTGRWGVR